VRRRGAAHAASVDLAVPGRHTHPWPLLVVVASGTLTRYDAECHARRAQPIATALYEPSICMRLVSS
jgi:hypothetical protein